jgi:formylglycine-generating enzyme required for sulfatase activity
MIGNVAQWCQDWYGIYPAGSVTDPQGAASGLYRVMRSGVWYDSAYLCRSASRSLGDPVSQDNTDGFRIVLAPGQ